MTPSNNQNGQPLIYRIADALGVFHLVAPVNHTHTMSEVAGLESALEGKQNTLTFDTTPTANSTNPVTSGGVKAALDGKSSLVGPTISLVINGQEIEIEPSDVPNLIRALSIPDSTPTADSDKLVTSGGVAAALEGKANQVHMHTAIGDEESSITVGDGEINIELSDPVTHSGGELNITVSKLPNLQRAINAPDSTPTANSNNLVTSGGVKNAIDNAIAIRYYPAQSLIEDIFGDANLQKVDCGILNSTGSEASITDLFSISAGQTLLLPDNAPTIPNGKMVLLRLYRTTTQGQFMVSIGGIYTIS